MKESFFLPLTNQVMFGAGAPCALHEIVASFPSKAVKFCGGFTITGDDAENKFDLYMKFYLKIYNNLFFEKLKFRFEIFWYLLFTRSHV